jgi:prepilin-type N-terminal cleavage/methylation domain-containing protein
MRPSNPSDQIAYGGFTLIEVLVSSAVLAIVLGVMFAALSTSLSTWRNTDNKIVADREARAAELVLAQDLSSAIVTTNVNMWPRVVTNSSGMTFLQFLTLRPPDYQAGSNNIGDICYVEYVVVTTPLGRELRRMFWGSQRTYNEIIRSNSFRGGRRPATLVTNEDFQSLAMYLLPTNKMAARGLGQLVAEANNTNFVVLGTNALPLTNALSSSNYPVAIEVNFAVADPETLANSNVIASSNVVLRNAGLYSFRIPLPKPPSAP